jgi:hypothetical protein
MGTGFRPTGTARRSMNRLERSNGTNGAQAVLPPHAETNDDLVRGEVRIGGKDRDNLFEQAESSRGLTNSHLGDRALLPQTNFGQEWLVGWASRASCASCLRRGVNEPAVARESVPFLKRADPSPADGQASRQQREAARERRDLREPPQPRRRRAGRS